MIARYSRPEMTALWSEEAQFQAWLEVEIEACAAWSKIGVIPAEDVELIRQNAGFDVDRIHEIEEITRHDVVAFTRSVSESLGDERKWIVETGDDYCQKLRLAGLNAPRVTDKMPMNFRHIGLIKTVFPDAKIVHMTRDPRDSCLSNYKQYFDTGGNQYVYDLRELGAFYVMYRDLMDHWHAQFPGEIHDCSYESLVGDPETQSRQLLDYCELEWEDAVLTFHTSKRAVRTASVSQVRNEIYTTSVQSWRRYETQLAPLINVISAAGRLPD